MIIRNHSSLFRIKPGFSYDFIPLIFADKHQCLHSILVFIEMTDIAQMRCTGKSSVAVHLKERETERELEDENIHVNR